jgi:hypothetical protein
MRRSQRLISAAVLIALSSALAGCGSTTGWDPTDLLDFLDTKKKLPGDRKPVFPEGVPGMQQGVPREMYKGSAEQQQQTAVEPVPAPPVEEPKPKRGSKPKAGSRPAAVSNAPAQETAPAVDGEAAPEEQGSTAAAPPAPKAKIVRRRTTAPPPDQSAAPSPQAQQAAPAASSPFPAPVPSGTFQR